jgi:hypothetical protein
LANIFTTDSLFNTYIPRGDFTTLRLHHAATSITASHPPPSTTFSATDINSQDV